MRIRKEPSINKDPQSASSWDSKSPRRISPVPEIKRIVQGLGKKHMDDPKGIIATLDEHGGSEDAL